jgi:signal transduction histidine kinase
VTTDLGELPPFSCHLGAINQVFLNLILNAADAIEESVRGTGRIGHIGIKTRCEDGQIVIAVSDDGAGIPPAVRSRIFEQFFTTKPVGKGTGQGLAITRQIVLSHDGTITFSSEEGKGTTFLVRFPATWVSE